MMHSFKSEDGREVEFVLNVGVCKKVLGKYDVDIMESAPNELLDLFLMKPLLRSCVMYEWVVDQSLSQDEFDAMLTGDVARKAEEAFEKEMLFFTQSLNPSRAKVLEKMLEKLPEVLEMQQVAMDRVINSPEAVEALDSLVDNAVKEGKKQFGNLYTKQPER